MMFIIVVAIAIVSQLSCTVGEDETIDVKVDSAEAVRETVQIYFTPDSDSENAVQYSLNDFPKLHTHHSFNKSRPTVIYVHGWLESGESDLSVNALRGAYVGRNDHNFVSVDWSYYSKNILYKPIVIWQLKVISNVFAEVLQDFFAGYNVDDLHLVGFSLGGQVIGKAGRQLKEISNGELEISRMYALDPAGPGFEDSPIEGMEAIHSTDAKYVQVIHTCGGKLGMLHRVGKIDFYPDGGTEHPGCGDDIVTANNELAREACNHARSWQFYQESVREPRSFPSIRCISYEDFLSNGTCVQDDIAYMGFGAALNETGKYFLQTNDNLFGFSRGMKGIKPKKGN